MMTNLTSERVISEVVGGWRRVAATRSVPPRERYGASSVRHSTDIYCPRPSASWPRLARVRCQP